MTKKHLNPSPVKNMIQFDFLCFTLYHRVKKTFAPSVLLYNEVPVETVSELLGHSSMKITQEYYGKVVQKRGSEEMERLMKTIKEGFSCFLS